MKAETLVQTILDEDYAGLKDTIEKIVAKKLHNRILTEKTNVLAKMNRLSSKKMAEIIATSMKN
jgi:hypothetical protein